MEPNGMEEHKTMENKGIDNKFLPAAVVFAGVLIAGAVIWSGSHPVVAPTGTGTTATAINIKNVKITDEPYIGQASAPVTIAFWSDFQCPYCKAFELGGVTGITTPPALPDIIKNYVDTGKARIVFMDYPFLGKDSVTAALYGRSIWKLYPTQYFAWRTAMYKAQDEEGDRGFGNAASIDKLNATIVGIDATKVIADVAANTVAYQALIDVDKAELQKLASQPATPSFVIGQQFIAGAYPYANFQAAIDAALK